MTLRTLAYLLIIGTSLGCNQEIKEEANPLNEKLVGEWGLIVENTNQFDFYRPFGIAFSIDSIEFFNGFFKKEIDSITGKRKYRYFGNFTNYKIQSDSIFIQSVFDYSWKYWNSFIDLKGDTLLVADSDSIQKKFVRLNYNLDTMPRFEQIIFSSSGCYGSCPILDFSLNRNGQFFFQGEGYTESLGFFKGKLTRDQTNFIFNKFRKADILHIDKDYDVGHTDDQSITTTYIVNGKIVKTIHDYGMAGPSELVWAYIPISNAYKQVDLDSISEDDPFYPKLSYFTFHKDSLILSLEKSESFYLWTELKNSNKLDTTFKSKYELDFRRNYTYWGPDPNESRQHKLKIKSIKTDGRLFRFYFENDKTITYDIGYNYIDRNFDENNFRKPKDWEL